MSPSPWLIFRIRKSIMQCSSPAEAVSKIMSACMNVTEQNI
jgi:hypothetical protein